MTSATIILPNQLFENHLEIFDNCSHVYIIEDPTFFTKFLFHKMKLILHRASLKFYYDYLSENLNAKIKYIEFNKVDYHKIFSKHDQVNIYDPIDHSLGKQFNKFKKQLNIFHNPLFIETNEELTEYYNNLKSHTHFTHDNSFYRWQRKRLNILVDAKGKPIFGKWSYDHNNRQKFNNNYVEPKKPAINKSEYVEEAKKYVEKHFSDNFGETEEFIYPVDFISTKKLFINFINKKLITFGNYEDASNTEIDIGSHSLLSASINIGLITVDYILKKILDLFNKLSLADQKKIINSVEGFIRQIIGWRSYTRFIYLFHGSQIYNENRLNHTNKLSKHWFDATTDIYPIDFLINKVRRLAYTHHIERLMYLGNFALLTQLDPKEIYKWFMICYIDSYEWVMVPNVMGMSQYSTESITMMTRPYYSSSNYIKNMSNFKLNSYDKIDNYYWNEIFDALYYNFINDNIDLLKSIYATAMSVKNWTKKNKKEQNRLLEIADFYLTNY